MSKTKLYDQKKSYFIFSSPACIGYSKHFLDATHSFPEICYKLLVPIEIHNGKSACDQLSIQFGIKAEEVNYIFISHFHGDHYAGLKDFPQATFVYAHSAYEFVKHKGRVASTCCAFLPKMLPDDFLKRSRSLNFDKDCENLPSGFGPFTKGFISNFFIYIHSIY